MAKTFLGSWKVGWGLGMNPDGKGNGHEDSL